MHVEAESDRKPHRDVVRRWRGTWANEAGSDQWLAALTELRAMATRYGIELPEYELFAERLLGDEEPVVFPPDTGP
jgi:hypothetical protein